MAALSDSQSLDQSESRFKENQSEQLTMNQVYRWQSWINQLFLETTNSQESNDMPFLHGEVSEVKKWIKLPFEI